MSLVFQSQAARLYAGSCLDVLKELPDNSIDSIVTDPPYGLSNTDPAHVAEALGKWGSGERDFIPAGKGFMGKAWDAFVPPPAVWDECLRVLKPGGHLLAFAGSRTFDLMALSIRLAGFEIRDSVAWLYGSGFPKSLDVSKAIDKAAGAEREVLTRIESDIFGEREVFNEEIKKSTLARNLDSGEVAKGDRLVGSEAGTFIKQETAPATPEAQKWAGWGTALKPAFEPVVVARKPLIGTVAENVLQYGTGGLNIDGTRIATRDRFGGGAKGTSGFAAGYNSEGWEAGSELGRWPANVMLDEYTAALLDEQSGVQRDGVAVNRNRIGKKPNDVYAGGWGTTSDDVGYGGSGGASRFFYVAKASKRDRNEGLDGLEARGKVFNGKSDQTAGNAPGSVEDKFTTQPAKNFHPTVKPTDLMRRLVRLVTPPGGTVLDPFTGSGSTGKAAILEGFQFVGIELTDEYLPIIEGRLLHAEETLQAEIDGKQADEAETLFSLDDSA